MPLEMLGILYSPRTILYSFNTDELGPRLIMNDTILPASPLIKAFASLQTYQL
jgi:hypothetical protein